MTHGRRTPYTLRGIRRLPCARGCGRRAVSQWQVCADRRVYRPLCLACDVELNALVLRFMNDPAREIKMAEYVRTLVSS